MSKSFDFNKLKPKTMTVTLSDEEKTVLTVMTPDKKLRDELEIIRDSIEESDEDELNEALYEATAKVLSRNKQGIEITVEKVKKLFDDIEYVLAFLDAYSSFVNELSSSKN